MDLFERQFSRPFDSPEMASRGWSMCESATKKKSARYQTVRDMGTHQRGAKQGDQNQNRFWFKHDLYSIYLYMHIYTWQFHDYIFQQLL